MRWNRPLAAFVGGQADRESGEESGEWHRRNLQIPNLLISNSSLSTNHSPLFTIKTPTATVTDLGTEFGVEVDKQGSTTSHVFRGLVRVQVVAAEGNRKAPGRCCARTSRHGWRCAAGAKARSWLFQPPSRPSFVREIPKPTIKMFDLVDVVAGGDGFSGRRNAGIDPTNGRPTDRPPDDRARPVGDGKYHRVEGLPLVDGVFIPDGRHGPVQVDSAGHVFDGCPDTSNQTAYYVWAGSVPGGIAPIPTKFEGIDYAASGHGVLFMLSNKGITFDLDAVRRANPGHKLVRFRAVTGNVETRSAQETGAPVGADVWVLVDGEVRFRRREINGYNGLFPIALPLGENDRFLTLVATDGGNGIEWDWILFGDPRLELLPVQTGSAGVLNHGIP